MTQSAAFDILSLKTFFAVFANAITLCCDEDGKNNRDNDETISKSERQKK